VGIAALVAHIQHQWSLGQHLLHQLPRLSRQWLVRCTVAAQFRRVDTDQADATPVIENDGVPIGYVRNPRLLAMPGGCAGIGVDGK
jgi:hypothetical protein